MPSASWLRTAVGAAGLFLSIGTTEGLLRPSFQSNELRSSGASISYRPSNYCPVDCSVAGPNPANWTTYKNMRTLSKCDSTVFYQYSLTDLAIDDNSALHRIYACTGLALDSTVEAATQAAPVQTLTNATFTLGSLGESSGSLSSSDVTALSEQMREFLSNGFSAAADKSLVLYAQTVNGTAGLYIGRSVQVLPMTTDALSAMEIALSKFTSMDGESVAYELCGEGYNANHVFGFVATNGSSPAAVQQALQSWHRAQCLNFSTAQNITGTASFLTPLALTSNGTYTNTTGTYSNSTTGISINGSSSVTRRSRSWSKSMTIRGSSLARRDDCSTVQVVAGDTCATLVTECGITTAEFDDYNSASDLCSTLVPGQHVCCTSGTLPDFAPSPQANGSCSTYTIASGDTCSALSAAYDLTNDKIDSFNQETWGWAGCDLLYIGSIICLSTGDPPMPAALANAECGPQVPGTPVPADGTSNLSGLNPCPLNACCDIWGECGITDEFCTNSSTTGVPGTAAKGTNGCISNCGTDIISGDAPDTFIKLGYYEGFGIARDCLLQDVRQIDVRDFTHVHFGFGTIGSDYSVSIGTDNLTTYEFDAFKEISTIHKVISFGGWAFSTDPSTYSILREGVTSANRLTLATNIANFVKDNDMDGVDIDWEYPGEPDIPGIPAGSTDDGANYLAFLVILKNLLGDKTVSIAAPASYWYLKAFPIAEISKVIDYIVFMTYDLHGQWDYGSEFAQVGCSNGNCLRSHVNLTETELSLAMITKAGVPSGKTVVGVSSYGRSFAMEDGSCYTADCFFTGTSTTSDALPGACTNTSGYIGDAEIYAIIADSSAASTTGLRIKGRQSTAYVGSVQQNYVDEVSHSRVVVYDTNQWVAFMDDDIRTARTSLYTALNMGGTTNWATDLETFNSAPNDDTDWATFKELAGSGDDPYVEGPRTGNWTSLTCSSPAVQNIYSYNSEERWAMLDGADAWSNILDTWTNTDQPLKHFTIFSQSVSNTLHGPQYSDCGSLADDNYCETIETCSVFEGEGTGAIAYEIWNSFVQIHGMYATYSSVLTGAVATAIDPALGKFEDTFAPTPPENSDEWLEILLDVLSLVGVGSMSVVFNSVLKGLDFFSSIAYDNSKDISRYLVAYGLTITNVVTSNNANKGKWSSEDQDDFNAFLGQMFVIWQNITDISLQTLFDGSTDSLNLLTEIMGSGQWIAGAVDGTAKENDPSGTIEDTLADMENDMGQMIWAYAIPAVWSLTGVYPFVLDTGVACSDEASDTSINNLVTDYTAKQTSSCYEGKLYYLVNAPNSETCSENLCVNGNPTFSTPTGLTDLDGSAWNGLTIDLLVAGAVKTYVQNGNANGGAVTDPSDDGSLNDLINFDVTTPGYVRIPVCSATMAYKAWDDPDLSKDNPYPCVPRPTINDCSDSTFVDETSGGSPLVSDCQALIKTIEGTQDSWTVALTTQHQILKYGTCQFGVQATGSWHGDIYFKVGSQDVVDVITQSISLYGGSGRVGAKGTMSCQGDINNLNVLWGLY